MMGELHSVARVAPRGPLGHLLDERVGRRHLTGRGSRQSGVVAADHHLITAVAVLLGPGATVGGQRRHLRPLAGMPQIAAHGHGGLQGKGRRPGLPPVADHPHQRLQAARELVRIDSSQRGTGDDDGVVLLPQGLNRGADRPQHLGREPDGVAERAGAHLENRWYGGPEPGDGPFERLPGLRRGRGPAVQHQQMERVDENIVAGVGPARVRLDRGHEQAPRDIGGEFSVDDHVGHHDLDRQ